VTHHVDIEAITLLKGNHSSPEDGMCVEWSGPRDSNGYGRSGHGDRAHRVAWEAACGDPIPDGMVVMHLCDNPPCVNPAHLRLGTVAENNRDRHAKGRTKNLELGPHARVARTTHCPAGHAYAGENLMVRANGARECRECGRAETRRYLALHRVEHNARRRAARAARRSAA
jgi:hypothetical protein